MSETYQVEDHLSDKDAAVRQTYDALIRSIRQFGDVTESPKKTSIHLDHKHGFAGVNTRKSYLLLNFRTSYKLDHPRITKMEQHSANRFMHTVKLTSPDEIDAELVGWLKDAYELAG